MRDAQRDLTRTVLAIMFLAILIGASMWVLRPFLPALVWATMVVIATWPILLALQRGVGGRRWLAVTVLMFLMLVLLIVPLALAIGMLVGNAAQIEEWVVGLKDVSVPPPPGWVAGIPLAGERLAAIWSEMSGSNDKLVAAIVPHLKIMTTWLLGQFGSIGAIFLHLALVVVGCAILYANGEAAATGVRRFATRLAGERGDNSVTLAGSAIRGVAMGVIVTALVQSILAGLGLWIAGIPVPALLTAVIFMLGVAQLGPILIMLPAVIWLFWSDQTGMGIFLLIWTVIVGSLDNVLRPILIRRGADLPLLLIFSGVIGGLVGFGLVGIFVGPVMLAVTYTLLNAWIDEALGPALPVHTDAAINEFPKPAPPATSNPG